MYKFIISLYITSIMGCTQWHYVTIDPYIPVSLDSFKNRIPIGLQVINARSTNNIAHRAGPDLFLISPKFIIRSRLDLTDTVKQRIKEGLTQMGFKVTRIEKSPNKTLTIEITRLKSRYKEKLPKFDVKVEAGLRVKCINGGSKYLNNYSHKNQLTSAPASTFPNENLINETLSETLKKIFKDKNLMACLEE